MGQCLCVFETTVDLVGGIQMPGWNVQSPQYWLGHQATLCLPGVFFTPMPPGTDKHEQGNFVEQCQRDDGINRRQKTVSWHQQGGIDTRQECTCLNTATFFLSGESYKLP